MAKAIEMVGSIRGPKVVVGTGAACRVRLSKAVGRTCDNMLEVPGRDVVPTRSRLVNVRTSGQSFSVKTKGASLEVELRPFGLCREILWCECVQDPLCSVSMLLLCEQN
jgi:hypothetical protein